MSLWLAVKQYTSMLGCKGLYLAAKSRLLRRKIEIAVSLFQYKQPLHMRLRSSDVTLLKSILFDCEYDIPLAEVPKVIVDAGANVGFTSVWYANRYPDATIIAIEPEKDNFSILQKNISNYRNIKALRAALWKENGTLLVTDPGLGSWAFQVFEQSAGGVHQTDNQMTEAYTLDWIMSHYGLSRIDVLKVDIEGAEKEVFENCRTWIENVDAIVVELHDRYKPGCARAVRNATREFSFTLNRGEIAIFSRVPLPIASSPRQCINARAKILQQQT